MDFKLFEKSLNDISLSKEALGTNPIDKPPGSRSEILM